MRNKFLLLIIAVALAAGAYWYFAMRTPQAAKTEASAEAAHAEGDKDAHGHGEHKDDHAEGGEHAHGDKDEHAEGKDEHDHGSEVKKDAHGDEEGGHEEGGDKTKISDEAAANAEIKVLEAAPASIHDTISLTGRITLNQNTSAQVKARFPGIVRSVSKGLAEQVTAGETLATVESNDSLLVYPVKAPISGVILQRNTNIGDVAGDQPLFMISNLSDVWAEFFIFPRDMARIKSGQKVHINATDDSMNVEAPITSLLPVAEASSQTVIARVTIANPDGQWRSGMTVRGDVIVAEKQVPVAVASIAIQRQEGASVVFVQEGTAYEARKVELGLGDAEWTEIKSGLKAGERYVAQNSFVVKADIGKAGAEHAH
jgi:cobalt-zinc-cadmium efflux system membrane fusion protein